MDLKTEASAAILTAREGAVFVITLNRPERLNALTNAMLHRLGDVFLEADADPAVRAIVFQAEGRGFCAGADAEGLEASANRSVEEQLKIPMPKFTARHVGIFKPVICAVNGVCAGAGLHFVADSEIVIAAEGATFTDTHVNVGQVTALEPIGLSRRMPLGAVLRMVVLGKAERMTAQQAHALGMVSEIVPLERLRDRAMELARIAASASPAAMRASLKAVWESLEMPLSEAYAKGYEAVVRHRDHPDAAEGPRAFMEKREPRWSDGPAPNSAERKR
ncbi:MAG: enoyl-CoA hydratase/isomerase family protein [Hyphomonadaceae bacterium]